MVVNPSDGRLVSEPMWEYLVGLLGCVLFAAAVTIAWGLFRWGPEWTARPLDKFADAYLPGTGEADSNGADAHRSGQNGPA